MPLIVDHVTHSLHYFLLLLKAACYYGGVRWLFFKSRQSHPHLRYKFWVVERAATDRYQYFRENGFHYPRSKGSCINKRTMLLMMMSRVLEVTVATNVPDL